MCSMPCSCVQIYMLDTIPCASIAFMSFDISLSCVLALQVGCRSRSCGLGLHAYTQAYINGFGSFPLWMCMLACFCTLYPCFPAYIQVFAMLCSPYRLVLIGLRGHLLKVEWMKDLATNSLNAKSSALLLASAQLASTMVLSLSLV